MRQDDYKVDVEVEVSFSCDHEGWKKVMSEKANFSIKLLYDKVLESR